MRGRRDPKRPTGSSSAFADLRLAQEPFNPGFQAAKPGFADEKEAVNGSGASSTTGLHPPPGQRKAPSNDDDDDDIYEATPKSKEPMHRY
ncbi:hypothetical protein ACCO45_009454 [Purpureocillium lilacinum]|uniref:Uncharacterized protein n=1 Tax=Purpureocillium lilacinum TaxID=33203 RepID=A0ACC4DKI7_PURLI